MIRRPPRSALFPDPTDFVALVDELVELGLVLIGGHAVAGHPRVRHCCLLVKTGQLRQLTAVSTAEKRGNSPPPGRLHFRPNTRVRAWLWHRSRPELRQP